MSDLAPADTQRLTKLCGMLGSAHAGERAAAALKAHNFLVERELSWSDIIGSSSLAPPRRGRVSNAGQCRCAFLLECGFAWNEWELQFLTSLTTWEGEFTPKQSARLFALDEKASAWMEREGR